MLKSTDCSTSLPTNVDDIHICSLFNDIDGVSGVLGYAGPRVIDVGSSGITRAVTGDSKFDAVSYQ
jgi:hypothetical protein